MISQTHSDDVPSKRNHRLRAITEAQFEVSKYCEKLFFDFLDEFFDSRAR